PLRLRGPLPGRRRARLSAVLPRERWSVTRPSARRLGRPASKKEKGRPMGNKVCRHNRVILTSDIALHFKSSNLVRDVLPIIERWQLEGSDMCLTIPTFKEAFDVVSDASAEQQFRVFDTKGTGKVDACQVLMVYIFLSQGDLARKVDAVFSTFGFEGSQGAHGSISFDEAIIMLTACIQGTQKVCQTDFEIPDNEIPYHCKSLFDLHRLSYDKRIARSQFDEWVWNDPSPRSSLLAGDVPRCAGLA
ncbi:unnamed protein product, partial [Prorocentrum cordatum]